MTLFIFVLFLESSIELFMAHFRQCWPEVKITPKLHLLEDHVIPFVKKWQCGFGFYGEQGGESIHSVFNNLDARYRNIRNPSKRLRFLMEQHLMHVAVESAKIKPAPKKRRIDV